MTEEKLRLKQIKIRKEINKALKHFDDRMHELLMGRKVKTSFKGLLNAVQSNIKQTIDVS